MAAIELKEIKIFDVLRNSLTGELMLVLSVSGDRLDLRDKSGALARYKHGKHFSRAEHDEAVDFRAHLRTVRAEAAKNGAKKKRPRSLKSFLNKLAKRR